MDKVQIKRAKRNKRKPTLKEKILAGAGLGATFIGGAAGMSRGMNQQRMVSTISRDLKASGKKGFGEHLKRLFSVPKAKAADATVLSFEVSQNNQSVTSVSVAANGRTTISGLARLSDGSISPLVDVEVKDSNSPSGYSQYVFATVDANGLITIQASDPYANENPDYPMQGYSVELVVHPRLAGDNTSFDKTVYVSVERSQGNLPSSEVTTMPAYIFDLAAQRNLNSLSLEQQEEISNYFVQNSAMFPANFLAGSFFAEIFDLGSEIPNANNGLTLQAILLGYEYQNGRYEHIFAIPGKNAVNVDSQKEPGTIGLGIAAGSTLGSYISVQFATMTTVQITLTPAMSALTIHAAGKTVPFSISQAAHLARLTHTSMSMLKLKSLFKTLLHPSPAAIAIAGIIGVYMFVSWYDNHRRIQHYKEDDSRLADDAFAKIRRVVDIYNSNRGPALELEQFYHDRAVELVNHLFNVNSAYFKLPRSLESQRGYLNQMIASMDSTLQQRLSNFRSMLANTRVNQARDGSREAWMDEYFGWVVVYADGTAVSEKGREVPTSVSDAIKNSQQVNNVNSLWFNPRGQQPPPGNAPDVTPPEPETPPPPGGVTGGGPVVLPGNSAPSLLSQQLFPEIPRETTLSRFGRVALLNGQVYDSGGQLITNLNQGDIEQLVQAFAFQGVRNVAGLGNVSVSGNQVYDSGGQNITDRLTHAEKALVIAAYMRPVQATMPSNLSGNPPANTESAVSNLTFRVVGGPTLPNNNSTPHPVAVGQSWEIRITGPVGAQVTAIGGRKTGSSFEQARTPSGTIPASGVLVLNGTFASEDKGEWRIAWQAGSQTVATVYFNLQDAVSPPAGQTTGNLQISSAALPSATVGQFYNQALAVTGGTGPFVWTLEPGTPALPLALNLSPSGAIMGVPTSFGLLNFTVRVRDSQGRTAARQLSLNILQANTGGGGSAPPIAAPPPVVVTAPIITQLTPASVELNTATSASGQEITILGSNFNPSASMNMVFFGNTMATASQVIPGGIKVKIPGYLKAGSYKVKTANISDIAKVSNELNFTITAAASASGKEASSVEKKVEEKAETAIYGIPADLQEYVFKKLPKSKAWAQFKAWAESPGGKKNFAIKGVNPKTGEAFRLVVSKGQARHIVEKINQDLRTAAF